MQQNTPRKTSQDAINPPPELIVSFGLEILVEIVQCKCQAGHETVKCVRGKLAIVENRTHSFAPVAGPGFLEMRSKPFFSSFWMLAPKATEIYTDYRERCKKFAVEFTREQNKRIKYQILGPFVCKGGLYQLSWEYKPNMTTVPDESCHDLLSLDLEAILALIKQAEAKKTEAAEALGEVEKTKGYDEIIKAKMTLDSQKSLLALYLAIRDSLNCSPNLDEKRTVSRAPDNQQTPDPERTSPEQPRIRRR